MASHLPVQLGKQPLRFEPREDGFIARRGGAALELTPAGATLAVKSARLSMKVAGGRPVAPVASNPLATKMNYFLGRDPARWRRDVPTFGTVTYPSARAGVDLVFHGEQGQIEYDFVVAPGTDVADVAMEIGGTKGLSIDEKGDLLIDVGDGTIVQPRPHVYQGSHDVMASYRLTNAGAVAFDVGAYDHAEPLVIDPVIGFATYLGGNDDEFVSDVTIDPDGNTYITGFTIGSTRDFTPAHHYHPNGADIGGADTFIAKLLPGGALGWFTYVGGTVDDYSETVALDDSGNVFVGGATDSPDLPVTVGTGVTGAYDGFILRLQATDGTLTYGRYVDFSAHICDGQSSEDCAWSDDFVNALVFQNGELFVAGQNGPGRPTEEPFPGQDIPGTTTNPAGAFVFRFTPGSEAHEIDTFFTTGGGGSTDRMIGLQNGHLFVAMNASPSSHAPILTNADLTRGFQSPSEIQTSYLLAELIPGTPDKVGYLTGIGAAGSAYTSHGLAEAPDGAIWAYGDGFGNALPSKHTFGTTGSLFDLSIAKLDITKSGDDSLVFAAAFGGNGQDFAEDLAVDAAGDAFLVGETVSTDFPVVRSANRADQDGFLVGVAANGGILGTQAVSSDTNDTLNAIAFQPSSAVIAGTTQTHDPTAIGITTGEPIAQPAFGGGNQDAFIARYVTVPLAIAPDGATVKPGAEVDFAASGGGNGNSFAITTNNSSGSIDPVSGKYTAGFLTGVSDVVTVSDVFGETASASISVQANVTPLTLAPLTTSTAPGGTIAFTAGGGVPPYTFIVASSGSGGNVTQSGIYVAGHRANVVDTVRVTDQSGQTLTARVQVGAGITIAPAQANVAQRGSLQLSATGGSGGPYRWSASDGSIDASGLFTAPASQTAVTITATDNLGSTASASISVGGALAIVPADVHTYPRAKVQLAGYGGSGAGYTWRVATSPAQGGTVDAAGLFTAGPTPNVVETVLLTDQNHNSASVTITVGAGVTITPADGALASGQTLAFSAAGGSGAGYAFAVTTNDSGGGISNAGLYTAGPNAGHDTITLTDSAGNTATATVDVTPRRGTSASSSSGASAPSSSGAAGGSSGGAAPSRPTSTVVVNGGDGGGCAVANVGSGSGASSAYVLLGLAALLSARSRRGRASLRSRSRRRT